jgi:hypothetical protein
LTKTLASGGKRALQKQPVVTTPKMTTEYSQRALSRKRFNSKYGL